MKKICAVCGKEAALINQLQLADNAWICSACFKDCGFTLSTPVNKISAEEARRALREEEQDTSDAARPERVLHELRGLNHVLFVYKDRTVFSTSNTDKEEKTVYLSDIISIQYQKAGILKGYIQLFWPGVCQTHGDGGSQHGEISIEFSHDQNDQAEKIYAYLTRAFRKVKRPPALPASMS